MKTIVIIAALFVAGCGGKPIMEQHGPDQCLRARLFKECLAAVPAGPSTVSAVASGWAGVVDECASAASAQSWRPESQIKPECRQ